MSRLAWFTSPYVPVEWISAHGFEPRRVAPDHSAVAGSQGRCPFAAGFAQHAGKVDRDDVVVVVTSCDQMRRAGESLAGTNGDQLFMMNVPATWQTPTALQMYIDELQRLGRFLESRGGKRPSPGELRNQMRHDDALRRLRAAPARLNGAIPVALIGGPLSDENRMLFDLIERVGGRVVIDATETGERALPEPFDVARMDEDPLLELAETYFRMPDVFRRPNTQLYRYLEQQLAQREVRGMILVRCIWCDLWHAEFRRIREWAKLPAVEIDLAGEDGERERLRTRVESLMEALR